MNLRRWNHISALFSMLFCQLATQWKPFWVLNPGLGNTGQVFDASIRKWRRINMTHLIKLVRTFTTAKVPMMLLTFPNLVGRLSFVQEGCSSQALLTLKGPPPSVLQSALFLQRSRDQLLQQGMTGPSSRLRHPGSEPPNKDNTLWAFNVFNEGISYCDWKQNVPDSYHVGVADRQKLARLIWLVRVKIALYCSHLPEKVQA